MHIQYIIIVHALCKQIHLCYIHVYVHHLQPINLVQVSSCRVPSSLATDKTIHRRSQQLFRVRVHICGGDGEVGIQIKNEIKRMNKKEREDLLKEARLPIEIPTEHALAIKADLAISWNKLRTVRRYA